MTAHPGPCLRIRRFDESGDPQPGVLSAPTARRCEYLRDQWIDNRRHEVFQDKKDGEVYAIPTDEVHDPSLQGKAPGGRRVTRGARTEREPRAPLSLHLD